MRFTHIAMTVVAAIPFAAAPLTAAPAVNDSIVVSTAWLAAHLDDPSIVVIDVEHDDSYARGHIPGARSLSYMDVVTRRGGLGAELPPVEQLRDLFERLGISDATRVIVYAPEAPMAARVLFTLDYLGHTRFAFLDGGLAQWRAEGRAVTTAVPRFARGHVTPRPRPDVVATSDWIMPRVGRPGLALIDTRTDGEYVGAGERHGMPSEGHIAGARQLQWEQLFRGGDVPLLKDRAELAKLYADRVTPGDTVVTYCWIGYRGSMTYLVARYLGYPVRLYDGSYQDWLQRKLPVRAGNTP